MSNKNKDLNPEFLTSFFNTVSENYAVIEFTSDGEIVRAVEHRGDPGRLHAHPLREFATVDSLLLHQVEQILDDHELFEFGLLLHGEGGSERISQG